MSAHIVKRGFLGFAALLLCGNLMGCGFQPLYANGDSGIGAVYIKPIDGRMGYLIAQHLERKFGVKGYNANARVLTVKVENSFSNVALGANSYTSRAVINSSVSYQLSALAQSPAIQGNFVESNGYDVIGNAYGEVALGADTEDKLAATISDRIWLEILRSAHKK